MRVLRRGRRAVWDVQLDVAGWCQEHLGAPAVTQLWETGHLSRVLALDIQDGRTVVLKARPWDDALLGCHAVHYHMWLSEFPCAQPLTGPTRVGDHAVS